MYQSLGSETNHPSVVVLPPALLEDDLSPQSEDEVEGLKPQTHEQQTAQPDRNDELLEHAIYNPSLAGSFSFDTLAAISAEAEVLSLTPGPEQFLSLEVRRSSRALLSLVLSVARWHEVELPTTSFAQS